MSMIKVRIAQALKTFGLHPASELRELEQRLNRKHILLEERNEQLQNRNEHLESRSEQLQNRNDGLQSRNERLQGRNERLQNRNEQLQSRNEQLQQARQEEQDERLEEHSAGTGRKYQTAEEEPVWHRRVIGGRWEEVGQLQLDFLRRQGLEPHHFLLDVGCGSLRGGVRFIPYLEPGRYFGVDQNERLLDAGREEIEAANLRDHRPNLTQMDDFGFERLGRDFDCALANSVFTHLTLNSIVRCLVSVGRVLRPGGVFYATFFENQGGKTLLEPVEQGDGFLSFCDKDPFHYTRDVLEWACEGTGLTAGYIGDWGHPRNQVMMEFRKDAGF